MARADIGMNQHLEPLGIFALGFLDAAAALFDRADQGAGLVDYAIYPAAYCLRHGLEVVIKQMSIYVAYEMSDPRLLYVPGHGLKDAWLRIDNDLIEIVEDEQDRNPQSTGIVEQCKSLIAIIDELDALDPKGTLFRYPEEVQTSRERARALVDRPPPFQEVNLSDWAKRARSAFDSAQALLSMAYSRAADLAQERGDPPIHFHETVMKK